MTKRKFKESPIRQGEDEALRYQIDITPWDSGLQSTGLQVVVKTKSGTVYPNGTSGNPSVSGSVITTSTIQNLSNNHTYRLEVLFNANSGLWEAWGELIGEP